MRFQTTELPKIDLCTNSGKITVRPRVCYSIFDPTKALGVTADIECMIGLFVSKYLANRVIHLSIADAKLYLCRMHEPFSNYPAGSPRSTGSRMVDVWVAGWRSGYRAKAIDVDVSGPPNKSLYPLVYDINAQLCRVGTELNCLTFHVVDSVG